MVKTADGMFLATTHQGMIDHLKELLPDLHNTHKTMSDAKLREHYLEVMGQLNKSIIASKYFNRSRTINSSDRSHIPRASYN